MSVVELRFYAWDDPNGALLGTLTDADLESFIIRPEHRGAGSGGFSMSRSHPSATTALLGFGIDSLAGPRLVKVHFPWMPAPYDTDPAFAFWLWEGDFRLLDSNGDDTLAFSGPGVRGIWSEYVLYHSSTVSDQPARGSANVPGMWYWTDEPYGAIATRLFEEGRHNPYPGAAAADSTFEHVTIDFDRVNDSASVAWANIAEEYEFRIRTDTGTVLADLEEAGDFTIVGRPDLSFSAYGSYGTDRTGAAYGAGVVRVQGDTGTDADNVLTDLRRHAFLNRQRTHLLGEDKDGAYHTEIHPDYVSGPERWGSLESPETNDDTLLDKKASQAFANQDRDQNQLEVEVKPGNAETSGRYLPFVHLVPGDTITVDTGAGSTDYNNVAALLTAFRVQLASATDDATADLAARSLHVTLELNTRRVNAGVPLASPNSGSSGVGHTHPSNLCRPDVAPEVIPPTTDWSWPFTSGLQDTESGSHVWGGASTYESPGARWVWTGTATVNVYYTTSPSGNRAQPATDYELLVNVSSRSGSGTRALSIVWRNTANGTLRTDVLHADLPAGSHVFTPPTTPAGTAGFSIQCTSSGTADLYVSSVSLQHGGGFTDGIEHDGHPDLVGTGTRQARCDHRHDVHRDTAPTVDDDGAAGYKLGTIWAQLDDLVTPTAIVGVWMLVDVTTGAAVWLELGGGVTDHGALTGLADDDHPQYTTTAEVTAAIESRRWEAVTNGTDIFVWEGSELVHEWKDY